MIEGRLGFPGRPGPRVVLARPRSYMNEIGGPTKALLSFYKVGTDRLVAIHDELDIPFDTMRVKFGGGDNGHNGLKSIRRHLGTGDFYRVRVGVGRPAGNRDPVNHVLSPVPAAEREAYEVDIARAADAVVSLLVDGLETTQGRFNS